MYYLRYWARYVRKGEVKSGDVKNILKQIEVLGKEGCSF